MKRNNMYINKIVADYYPRTILYGKTIKCKYSYYQCLLFTHKLTYEKDPPALFNGGYLSSSG